jgi:hypothetical protein
MNKRVWTSLTVPLCIALLTGCGDKSDDKDTPAATPTPTPATAATDATVVDFSSESFADAARAIMPVGSLALSLVGETNGTPCDDQDNADDNNQPKQETFECRIAKIFADPEVYGGVGQEGVLESLKVTDNVFKKAATASCAAPLTAAAQDVKGPFLEETRKYSCGLDIPTATMQTNLKNSGLIKDATDAEIDQIAATFKAYIYWGETGEVGAKVKNFIAINDVGAPASLMLGGAGNHEKGVWRFQKNQATNSFEMTVASLWTEATYQSRFTFSGNIATHEFEVNMRRGKVTESDTVPFDVFMLKGKGYSQGAGKFYMLKMKCDGCTYNGTAYDVNTELTLCFAADTKTVVAESNCAEYATALNAIPYLEKTALPAAYTDIVYPTTR